MNVARNNGAADTSGQLRGQVWGHDAEDHLLDVHMSSLKRKKLEAHGPRIIQTVRAAGYVVRL